MTRLPRFTGGRADQVPARSLRRRISKFTRRHPSIEVVSPKDTIQGKLWEVHIDGSQSTHWDDPAFMMDQLESRYGR